MTSSSEQLGGGGFFAERDIDDALTAVELLAGIHELHDDLRRDDETIVRRSALLGNVGQRIELGVHLDHSSGDAIFNYPFDEMRWQPNRGEPIMRSVGSVLLRMPTFDHQEFGVQRDEMPEDYIPNDVIVVVRRKHGRDYRHLFNSQGIQAFRSARSLRRQEIDRTKPYQDAFEVTTPDNRVPELRPVVLRDWIRFSKLKTVSED